MTAPKFVTQATEIAHEDAVVALFSEAIEKAKDDVQKEQPRDSSVTDPARGLKLAVILQRKYISVIPEAAVELVKLDVERLSVAHNRLRQMPTRLASCHNLRYINLRRNRFKRFPEPLLEMTNLEILDLSKNGIESIPESIQNLKALRILSLELNRLTDLPTELVNINCLDLLIVTGNPLQTDLLAILLDHTLDIGNYPKAQKHCEEAATKDIREYLKQRQNNVQQKSQIGTAAAAHSTMLQEEVFRASEATARLNNRVVEATHSIAEDADTLVTHVTDGPSIHHIPTQPNTKINLPIQTNGSRTKFGKSYNGIHIQDNATVIMGDVAGNLVQEIHHHHHAKGPVNMESYPIRLERRNECFGMHTLETITSYQEAGLFRDRGTSTTIILRWTRDRDIGRVLFGEVYTEKQDLDSYSQVRAIKVLQRRHLMRKNVDYRRKLGFLMRLARSDYRPYFVKFFTWFETEEKMLIATEFVMEGDLSAYIHNGLSDEDSRPIALQIMQGLCILHRLDIVHRDIKPANIFVVKAAPDWHVKIGDFGFSKSTVTRNTILGSEVGTDGYKAPETLGLVQVDQAKGYDAKCDIWSFACLFNELSTGKVPFASIGELVAFCQSHVVDRWRKLDSENISVVHFAILKLLLQPEPMQRPSADASSDYLIDFSRINRFDLVPTSGSIHNLGLNMKYQLGMYTQGVCINIPR